MTPAELEMPPECPVMPNMISTGASPSDPPLPNDEATSLIDTDGAWKRVLEQRRNVL